MSLARSPFGLNCIHRRLFTKALLVRGTSYSTAVGSSVERKEGPAGGGPRGVGEEVVIPIRKERGPTDILRALAGTVRRDYTAAHYKYHDDPFFIPASNVQKRTYALAKESGRKAARYFLDKYPELFFRDDAEPKIPAFSYKDVYDENLEVVEEDLVDCINRSEVNNAMSVYLNLKTAKVDISPELTQALLELVCFCNSQDTPDEEFLEELWYKKQQTGLMRRSWLDQGFAEQMFKSLPEKDDKSYSTIIAGLAKHNQSDKAYNIYREAKEKGHKLHVETYNNLIQIIPFLRESSDSRWELTSEFLNEMKHENVGPNLGTFNAVLEVLSKGSQQNWKSSKALMLRVMVEMKTLGIKPSLASYYFLLIAYCRERGPVSHILYEIMDQIEGKQFTVKHPKDVNFLVTAMDVCNKHLSDIELAYRVHNLMQFGENHKLLGDAFKESIYYQNFFKLLCSSESADTIMDVYNKYVPSVYTPEPSVLLQLLDTIDLYEAYAYVPQIWSDMIIFEQTGREQLVVTVLNIISKTKQTNEELQKQFVTIASNLMEKVDALAAPHRAQLLWTQIAWTGEMLGNSMIVFLNGNELEKAFSILVRMEEQQSTIIGFPPNECLQKFCVAAAEANDSAKLLKCIKYSLDGGNTVATFVLENAEKFGLNNELKETIEKMMVTGSFLGYSPTLTTVSQDNLGTAPATETK